METLIYVITFDSNTRVKSKVIIEGIRQNYYYDEGPHMRGSRVCGEHGTYLKLRLLLMVTVRNGISNSLNSQISK